VTGPIHYLEAERSAEAADAVMNADYGWMASLSTTERLQYRMAYLAEAQVHATLAMADAHLAGVLMHPDDRREWDDATGRTEVTR
jgi:hypothetical protein